VVSFLIEQRTPLPFVSRFFFLSLFVFAGTRSLRSGWSSPRFDLLREIETCLLPFSWTEGSIIFLTSVFFLWFITGESFRDELRRRKIPSRRGEGPPSPATTF